MYGKSKIKQTKPVISANDSTIRLLTINNHRFVVGLEWETIKAQRKLMQQVKRIGKSRNLDVVAIRKAEAIQAGFAPKTRQKLRGAYSLIVSLASLLDGICIAVVKVGVAANDEAEYTLLGRTEKGAIHPLSDVVYPESKIKQVVLDLKQDLRGKQQDSEIKVYGEQDKFEWVTDPLDLNELLIPANISKEFRLKPLRWGMTKGQLTGFTVALLMSGVAVFFINSYLNEQDLRKRQAIAAMLQQQEEINKKARYQAALDNLKHPWITSPSIPIFLQGCENGLKKLQLSIKGWIPGSIKCTKEGIAVNYNRPDNSAVTTKEFVEAVKSIYGTSPDFNITETSMSAFFLPHDLPPNGDDPLQDMGEQLLKIISLFQSVNIPASLKDVEIKDVKTNAEGEELPLQDWQEFTFEVDTSIPPQLIFKNGSFIGVRLNSIVYQIGQGDGNINYKITGSVYGKRILKP